MAPTIFDEDCWDKDGKGGIDIHPDCVNLTAAGDVPVRPPAGWHPQSAHNWSQEDILVALGVSVAALGVVCGSVTGEFYCNQVDFFMRSYYLMYILQWSAAYAGTGSASRLNPG